MIIYFFKEFLQKAGITEEEYFQLKKESKI